MYDLLVASPHVRPGARYTPAEWRVYVEGYQMAVTKALQVMDLARDRWQLRRKAVRDAARRRRSA